MVARGQDFDYDLQIDGQVAAIRRFFAEVKPEVLEVEKQVYSKQYQYAGTLDLLIRHGGRWCVVDFKSMLTPSVPYQVAAYAQAVSEPSGAVSPPIGLGVEIRADGTYRMSEVYDLRRYRAGWLALLGSYNIRRQCKVKEEVQDEG
jgi:hypothetical protein